MHYTGIDDNHNFKDEIKAYFIDDTDTIMSCKLTLNSTYLFVFWA